MISDLEAELSGVPDEESTASIIGTKEYWERLYDAEMNNYIDHKDPGDVWFGKGLVIKMVKWIKDKIPADDQVRVLDLGCGNGHFLYALYQEGYTDLTGVDYTEQSIKFIERLSSDQNIPNLKTYVGDVTNLPKSNVLPENIKYNLILDKGTYDAIMLNPDRPFHENVTNYRTTIEAYLDVDGYFIIASCNWTKDELIDGFVNLSEPFLKFVEEIEAPKFAYGGSEGTIVTCCIFKRI